jgi:hypothetical protein
MKKGILPFLKTLKTTLFSKKGQQQSGGAETADMFMKDLRPPLNVPLARTRETITNCWLKIINKTVSGRYGWL